MKRTINSFKKVCNTVILSLVSISMGIIFTSCQGNPKIKTPYVYTSVEDSDFENMEALQLTKVMGNGINLGNTMESAGASWLGFNNKPEEYEKAWGQPKTTKAIFEGYKAAGIDSVRIPVAWMSTMDIANGDYKINDNFIAYVANIVNMALESDLIVVLNDHWDYGWWSLFGSGDKDEAYKVFDAIWDQVGTYFKDYSYKLIFEAGNEEWGDGFYHEFKIGSKTWCESTEPNLYGISEAEKNKFRKGAYDLIEEVGQAFVDKIRDQGGNNTKRFLLIPGYNTGMDLTADSRYKMPKDPTNTVQKLLVSVHYYAPANYAILSEDADWGKVATTWGTSAEVKEQNAQFALMKRFVDEGYGVIIGEYAPAWLKQADGTSVRKSNDTDWITNILDNSDKYNYCPMLWDCNGYFKKGKDNEGNTITLGFEDEDIAAIYINRNYASEKGDDPETPVTPADSTKKTATVGNNGIVEYTIPFTFSKGDSIVIQAKINGASNFNQIGFQTSADESAWHNADWQNTGYAADYVYSQTVTATTSGTEIYFKYIFQNLIDDSKETSSVTVSNVTVTKN